MKYCKKCGNLLDEAAISCPSCGAKVEDSSQTKSEEPVSFIIKARESADVCTLTLFLLILFQKLFQKRRNLTRKKSLQQ